jgi:predicted CXXCH cytochrome family protein
MRTFLVVCILLAGTAMLNFDLPSINPASEDKCTDCHAGLVQQNVVHPPAEKNCGICHESTGKAHPGDEKGFALKDELTELCYGCHDDARTSADESKHPHKVMKGKASCINCHSPHSSSEKKLLLKNTKELCLGCHNKSVTGDNRPAVNMKDLLETSKYIHPAVDRGGCSPCHTAHGSDNPYILNNAFPAGIYTQAVTDTFALCWDCHDMEMIQTELSTTVTGFRNGERNLHYVHIRGDKARSCATCHDVHAANNKHLVRDKMQFGNWPMPMNFIIEDDGGSCAPGCHGVKEYKRLSK